MANPVSKRNLLIYGGVLVFALGWGGGLLLGVLQPEQPETAEDKSPQVVDADDYAPESEATPSRKSSSLLEQVFGLDDLEEEKPSRPKPAPSPAPEPQLAEDGAGELADQVLGVSSDVDKKAPGKSSAQPARADSSVVLEESSEAPDAATATQNKAEPPAPGPTEGGVSLEEAPAPKKEFLDENPYK